MSLNSTHCTFKWWLYYCNIMTFFSKSRNFCLVFFILCSLCKQFTPYFWCEIKSRACPSGGSGGGWDVRVHFSNMQECGGRRHWVCLTSPFIERGIAEWPHIPSSTFPLALSDSLALCLHEISAIRKCVCAARGRWSELIRRFAGFVREEVQRREDISSCI